MPSKNTIRNPFSFSSVSELSNLAGLSRLIMTDAMRDDSCIMDRQKFSVTQSKINACIKNGLKGYAIHTFLGL